MVQRVIETHGLTPQEVHMGGKAGKNGGGSGGGGGGDVVQVQLDRQTALNLLQALAEALGRELVKKKPKK